MDRTLKRIFTFLITCFLAYPAVYHIYASPSKPELIAPQNYAVVTSIPLLEWNPAPGAQGYNWEVSTTTDIDETGYFFVDWVYYGSTIYTRGNISGAWAYQPNTWYYWHVWGVADEVPGILSDTWRFMIRGENLQPVIPQAEVSPESGDTEDTYVYTVVYKDGNNDSPAVIQVYIDGVPYGMTAANPNDPDYTDGKEYQYATTLPKGTHNYYIYCEDGEGGSGRYPSSGTILGPTVSSSIPPLSQPTLKSPQNNAELTSLPTLEWNPVSGAQSYYYEISTSSDTDSSGYFTNSVCTGNPPSTYANIQCSLQKNVWYYWHVWAAANGETSPPSNVWRFKIAEVNHEPVILHAGVSPGSGNTDDVYIFTATYTDEDNDPPSVINIYIDGVPHVMTAMNPGDTNYTDGKEYRYATTLGEGTHNYYIYCEDGRGGSGRYPDSGTLPGPTVSKLSLSATIKRFTVSPVSVKPGDHVGYIYELSGNGQPGTAEIVIYSPQNQRVHSVTKEYDSINIVTSSAALWQVPSSAEFGVYTVILSILSQGEVVATKEATFEVVVPTCTLTFVEDDIFFEVGDYKEYAVEILCEGDGYLTILDVSYSTASDMGIGIVSKPGKINAGETDKIILGLSSKSDVEKTIGFYLYIDYEDEYGQKGRVKTQIFAKLLSTPIYSAELIIVEEEVPESLNVNDEFALSITVKAQNNDVTNLQARLTTEPDYITVLTDKTIHHGTLDVDEEHTFLWKIKALKESTSQIKITITGDNINEKEIRRYIDITSLSQTQSPTVPPKDDCKIDTDGDGVMDCEDDCPNEKGDAVNKGCPINRDFIMILGIGAVVIVGGVLILFAMRAIFRTSAKSKLKSRQMQICPVCKNEIQRAQVICPYCGTNLDDTRAYDDETRTYEY